MSASSFPAGRPIGEAAVDLMQRVNSDFTYKSGSTTRRTKVGDLLRDRTGVCQDFSHFMVSGASFARTGRSLRERLPGHPAAAPAVPGRSALTPAMPGWAAGSPVRAGSISTRPTGG